MGKTVLIIDDDANIARTFARILQRHGYETDVALTGKEALQKTSSKHYAVVLIDVCLPDINGIELLDKLHAKNSKMVKIVVTGSTIFVPNKAEVADAYLLKPVKPQELLAIIEQKIK